LTREAGGGLHRRLAAGGAEKEPDDGVAVERVDRRVLFGAVFGDDEGRAGDVGD
jgi:hypothetical protein